MSVSKVLVAKQRQGFIKKPIPRVCGTCEHFKQDRVEEPAPWSKHHVYVRFKNARCVVGGFAVGKTSTCSIYSSASKEQLAARKK